MRMPGTSAARLAKRVARTLLARGHRAFLVGGCVRDLLLGREPKDYDIATDARPPAVLELFPGAKLVGARFGVVLVSEDDAQVEVATSAAITPTATAATRTVSSSKPTRARTSSAGTSP